MTKRLKFLTLIDEMNLDNFVRMGLNIVTHDDSFTVRLKKLCFSIRSLSFLKSIHLNIANSGWISDFTLQKLTISLHASPENLSLQFPAWIRKNDK